MHVVSGLAPEDREIRCFWTGLLNDLWHVVLLAIDHRIVALSDWGWIMIFLMFKDGGTCGLGRHPTCRCSNLSLIILLSS